MLGDFDIRTGIIFVPEFMKVGKFEESLPRHGSVWNSIIFARWQPFSAAAKLLFGTLSGVVEM